MPTFVMASNNYPSSLRWQEKGTDCRQIIRLYFRIIKGAGRC